MARCCLDDLKFGYVAMIEHRALERIAINQIALLCVDGIRGCHPCLVVNFHRDGATLHSTTHHTTAFKFDLSLDGFKTTKHCRVVWRLWVRAFRAYGINRSSGQYSICN